MKQITYDAEFGRVVIGPVSDDVFAPNYQAAQAEAIGEIIVEDVPNTSTEPTLLEKLRADVDFIMAMEGLL